MDKIKKLLPIGTFAVGLLLGWLLLSKTKTKEVIVESAGKTEVVFRDTCISNKIAANVTSEISTKTTQSTKTGRKITEESTAPVTNVQKEDTLIVTTFEKSYDYGLVKIKVKVPVKAKSVATGKIALEYQLDTVVLKEMTTVVNTVVVSKDTVDKVPTKVQEYFPVATRSGTYLGLTGGVDYNGKIDCTAGLQLSGERLGIGLYTYPKNWKHVGIQLNTKLVKVKK